MKKLLVLFILCFALKGYTQNIQGKIIDESTGETIPFVSLMIVGTQITSVSNENGEFIIKASALPVRLKFSHVSYQIAETEVNSTNNLVIKLKQASINLQEVKINPYEGQRILKAALAKAAANQNTNFYLKAFYRQLTSVNNTPTRIHEIFYDLKWNVNRTTGWLAQATRFAANKEGVDFDLSNQSYFTFSTSGYLMGSKGGTVVTEKNLSKFTVEIDRYIEQADQDIAVITCTIKKAGKSQFYANTTFYVGTEDFKIYRMENNIFNLPMTLSGGLSFKFPPIVKTVATFKSNSGAVSLLESISTKMYLSIASFNGRMNAGELNATISSLLTVFQEDPALSKENFENVNRNTKDKTVVESVKYNPDFWRNNPIVKQTSLEDKFSKMMEGRNAFGTMVNP